MIGTGILQHNIDNLPAGNPVNNGALATMIGGGGGGLGGGGGDYSFLALQGAGAVWVTATRRVVI